MVRRLLIRPNVPHTLIDPSATGAAARRPAKGRRAAVKKASPSVAWAGLLCLASACLICACSGSASPRPKIPISWITAPCPLSPQGPPLDPNDLGYFVDLAVVEFSPKAPPGLERAPVADVIRSPEVALVASPHHISRPGSPSTSSLYDAKSEGTHVIVNTAPSGDAVRLEFDMTINVDSSWPDDGAALELRRAAFRGALDLRPGEPRLVPESSAPPGGRRYATIVLVHVLRRQADLGRLLECRHSSTLAE